MTASKDPDSAFADLVDDLLGQVQSGAEPDLTAAAVRHPVAAERVQEALDLASDVAGRRTTSRPRLKGYEILRELGHGGMGTVYLARHEALDRSVALKVLPQAISLSPTNRQRFLAEARSLAKIKHEHVVDIHQILDEGDLLAFEMEFVDGLSMQRLLDELRARRAASKLPTTLADIAEVIGWPAAPAGVRTPTQYFVRIAIKVARALAAVHHEGLVHRDVKPANVLLRRTGEPVLADFGLVRASALELSQVGRFAGTPVYASPEQLRSDRPVGPTSDVYSLAVTLFECLTLSTPFSRRTTTELLQHIEAGAFPPLRRFAPDVPRDLETIVAHAAEVDPERRYASATEFADDLQRLLELQPITARPVGRLRRFGKFVRRHQRSLLAGCAGALLVGLATIPLTHGLEAAAREREHAREHAREQARTARQELLAIDARHGGRQLGAGDVGALTHALATYELALATDAVPAVRSERDVLRLAIWLRRLRIDQTDALAEALDSDEFVAMTADLGPYTVAAARSLAGDREDPEKWLTTIDGATAVDRATLGLLAFLLGNARFCEVAWGELRVEAGDTGLVDAGLGRLLLLDGKPDVAHGRLLQAQRQLPEAASLALDLAEATLQLGDLGRANEWLQRAGQAPEVEPLRRRLLLDMRAARERGADLDIEYQRLAEATPDDPTPRHRLAQMALRRGDLATARRHLDGLVGRWPAVARFRLDRARLALQQRDLPAYVDQVFAVLDQDYGARSSRGTCADLLEVLRIGGLEELYQEGLAAVGTHGGGRPFVGGEIPIHGFVAPTLARGFEPFVRFCQRIRLQARQVSPTVDVDADMATWFVSVPLAIAQLPPWSTPPSPPLRVAMAALTFASRALYSWCRPWAREVWVRLQATRWESLTMTAVEPDEPLPAGGVFGHAIHGIDDANGDGVGDLLVSCLYNPPDVARGQVLLVDGKTKKVLDSIAGDSARHMFGFGIAAGGDIDGDGRCDWIVGAPAGNGDERHGEVEVWSGASRAMLTRLSGDEPSFGAGVAALGDCDGDGCDEFAVASPPIIQNAAAQGQVQVYSGRTFAVLRTLRNDVAGVWYGACLANVGDADGDGCDDLAVGGNYGGAPGLVRLYSARTGAVLQTWTHVAPTSGFGVFVGRAGDIDGDGAADVIVSAVRNGAADGIDQVFVFSGRSGKQIAAFEGREPGDGFGCVVVPYAGSGWATTFAIGAKHGGPFRCGAVEFWSARGGHVSTLFGPGNGEWFGQGVVPVPDLDGDRLPEIFVTGAQGPDGRVWFASSRDLRLGSVRR